jgi:hypothetical protein
MHGDIEKPQDRTNEATKAEIKPVQECQQDSIIHIGVDTL